MEFSEQNFPKLYYIDLYRQKLGGTNSGAISGLGSIRFRLCLRWQEFNVCLAVVDSS